jgi:hypothetical protein
MICGQHVFISGGRPVPKFTNTLLRGVLVSSTLSILISGCVAAQPRHVMAAFDPDQARALLQPGTNRIVGSALMRQQNGGVVSCAGRPILLVPATNYAKERIAALYGEVEAGFRDGFSPRYEFDPSPAEYDQLMGKSTCDAQGNFEFNDVADGEFFLVGSISWMAGRSEQGGVMMRRITTRDGKTVRAVLSPDTSAPPLRAQEASSKAKAGAP